jgi:hypothetical protein
MPSNPITVLSQKVDLLRHGIQTTDNSDVLVSPSLVVPFNAIPFADHFTPMLLRKFSSNKVSLFDILPSTVLNYAANSNIY